MKNTKDIDGWFTHHKTYDFLLSKITANGKFVECGAWLGKSSSYLCDIVSSTRPDVSVFIIDTWKGSEGEINHNHRLAQTSDIYNLFLENMGDRKFIPIRKLSIEAALEFEDNSCDVVFIDMDHSYKSVVEDINTWLPKIKHGGFLAGHDYDKGWPGVIKAVNEKFQSNIIITDDGCWIYTLQ